MTKNIINKIDSYIDTEIKLITCYTEALYKNLKFYSLVENKEFIHGLELGSKKLLLGYLRDIRFYYRFLKDIANKYPEFDIKKIQKNIFILEASNIKKCYICLNDINIISFKEIIEQDMKFDVIIANPPYDRNLHLKILEKLIELIVIKYNGSIISINPSRWIQDPLAKYKKSSTLNRFKTSIADYINNIEFIDPKSAADLFGNDTGFTSNLGIYTFIKTGGFNYKKFENPIIDKVLTISKCPEFEEMKKDGWRVRIPYMAGDGTRGAHESKLNKRLLGKLRYFYNGCDKLTGKKWYECYAKTGVSKQYDEIPLSIKFNTEQECINFVNSFNTKFAKYYSHNTRLDVHVTPLQVLWTNNYKIIWTDKRFCEYFKITGYIDDEHAEPGSEWETILNEMK